MHRDEVEVYKHAFLVYINYIIILSLRYFKQKAEKENKRKKKPNNSDNETSEMATNFGTVYLFDFKTLESCLPIVFAGILCFNLN